jgi:hypothetical protein
MRSSINTCLPKGKVGSDFLRTRFFMSKLSPLGQSMASLFTPESERARAGQAKAASGGRGPALAPSRKGPEIQNPITGDSLGNGSSPGYESWGKKKAASSTEEDPLAQKLATPGGTVIEPPTQGPQLIRLSLGWEKILLAQKKLCEKAKNIFTRLEGPENYRAQRKSRLLSRKSRGCIVDLDIQEVQNEKAAAIKAAQEKPEAESA